MRNYRVISIVLAVVLLTVTGVGAGVYFSKSSPPKEKVIAVHPVQRTERVVIQQPVPKCNDENISGKVVGGVGGGVLGSMAGKGNGKTAATIGGTLAGAYIGGKEIPLQNITCN